MRWDFACQSIVLDLLSMVTPLSFYWLSSWLLFSWGIISALVLPCLELVLFERFLMFMLYAHMLLPVSHSCSAMPSDTTLFDKKWIVAQSLPGVCLFCSLTSARCLSCSADSDHGFPSGCTLYSWIRRGAFPLRGIIWWQHPSHHHLGERRCTHQHVHGPTDHHQCHRTDHQLNWPFNKCHWDELHRRVFVHSLWWVHYCQG